MKMIRPIVNIGKIIEPYEAVIVGFNGVLTDGNGIAADAVNALVEMKKRGKHIVLCSNTCMRVAALCDFLIADKVPLKLFDAVITAGEILHYKLKSRSQECASLGTAYYKLGSCRDMGIFSGLDYQPVDDISLADFVYMDSAASADDIIDKYLPELEHAAGLGLPFVCAGNDTSSYKDGKISLAPGALAEQYAVLGGKIITVGKPDPVVMAYCLEALPQGIAKEKILVIGDNLATDIKGANLAGFDSVLISKGVHVNFLGEGYISDVTKTRELSMSIDAYPDYVISGLRW
ncbi:MAG: HAD hydrolase-like protein [Pseudomonadota bacterium]|nr:HAD hydrolase-like protein [Pseudomonadota bacterium]